MPSSQSQFSAAILATVLSFAQPQAAGALAPAETPTELADSIGEAGTQLQGDVVRRYMRWSVTPGCKAALLDQNAGYNGVNTYKWLYENAYAMGQHFGLIEDGSLDDARLNAAMDGLDGRFSFTVESDGNCATQDDVRRLTGYSGAVMTFFSNSSSSSGMAFGYRPKSQQSVHIVVRVLTAAKTVTANVSADGTTYTIIAPARTEPDRWGSDLDTRLQQLTVK